MAANVDNLTMADFTAGNPKTGMRQSDIDAFGEGTVRVVTLPKGFKLFKLSKGEAAAHPTYGVTPWWSPVDPYKEDYEGAFGRYMQAKLNKIDMSSMVRYMSAVCIDWNSLDNYIEVETTAEISAFWGTFAPQKKWADNRNRNLHKEMSVSRTAMPSRKMGIKDSVMPEHLGALESWQFYIPKLKDEHIKRNPTISAHDMEALYLHFSDVLEA
ncbi:MAG: hypothetical protein R3240_07520 [Gammaproteobacteria bacterium]|nr:hypothetical protein [Gammaproteobacteria bacterium]